MLYSSPDKILIVGGADFSEDLFQDVYDNAIPIIAADGGANFLADHNIFPELIIGDLDSLSEQKIQNMETQKFIKISDQHTTDLEKVLLNTESPLTIGIGFLGSRIDPSWLPCLLLKFSHKIILIGEKDIVFLVPPSFRYLLLMECSISLSFRFSKSSIRWFEMVDRRVNHEPTDKIGTSNQAVGKIIKLVPDEPKLYLPKSLLNDAVLQLQHSPSWNLKT